MEETRTWNMSDTKTRQTSTCKWFFLMKSVFKSLGQSFIYGLSASKIGVNGMRLSLTNWLFIYVPDSYQVLWLPLLLWHNSPSAVRRVVVTKLSKRASFDEEDIIDPDA